MTAANQTPHDIPSGFLYFLAGSVASTGINLLTTIATSNERATDFWLLSLSAAGSIGAGYLLSRIAAGVAAFEERKASSGLDRLTAAEAVAVVSELRAAKKVGISKYLPLLYLAGIFFAAPLIIREIL